MNYLLTGARLIDGTGKVFESATLVIEGNRIKTVSASPLASDLSPHLDLPGKTILPGFIDCHVHLCMDPVPDPVQQVLSDTPALSVLRAARNARRTLEAGVTTVRDLGARDHVDFSLRKAIQMGICVGPRLFLSGRLICMTGGHGHWIGREADGPDEVRKAAREQLKAGADFIKLISTGGVLTPGVEPGATQLSYEELRAGIEEARKAGKRTAAHAQGSEGIMNAVKAGIHSIEHGFFMTDEIVEAMVQRNVFFVPTCTALYRLLEYGTQAGIPPYVIEKAQKAREHHAESFKKAHRAGVKIAMGTDAGTPFNSHGGNLKELEWMVTLGMTPMEALLASTRHAAELLGMEAQLGTLEEGKLADLVVVEGNPLEDIQVLQDRDKIAYVFKDGEIVKQAYGSTPDHRTKP